MPENYHPEDPNNPYADYSVHALYSFLSSYELRRDIGIKYVYSNLGFGLLGLGIAEWAGVDYEQLVVPRPLVAIERASGSVKETWPSGACAICLPICLSCASAS